MSVHPTLDLVFVCDTDNARMQSFRHDGTLVKQWGSHGAAAGEFDTIRDMAILENHPTRNWIFITDCLNHRVQVFDVDGVFIRKWGIEGRGDGQFMYPCGVAVLARSQDRILVRSQDGVLQNLQKHPTQGLVYIADSWNHRVQVFDLDGTFIRKWGVKGSDNGQFNYPYGIAVHPTRDLIFISEEGGHRIQVFRSDGTFLYKWGAKGSADGQFACADFLALHPIRNLVFVVDHQHHRVQIFDLEGTFVCKWGVEGDADGEFCYPSGVSVHQTNDMVYVSDEHRVQAFSLFPAIRKKSKILD